MSFCRLLESPKCISYVGVFCNAYCLSGSLRKAKHQILPFTNSMVQEAIRRDGRGKEKCFPLTFCTSLNCQWVFSDLCQLYSLCNSEETNGMLGGPREDNILVQITCLGIHFWLWHVAFLPLSCSIFVHIANLATSRGPLLTTATLDAPRHL